MPAAEAFVAENISNTTCRSHERPSFIAFTYMPVDGSKRPDGSTTSETVSMPFVKPLRMLVRYFATTSDLMPYLRFCPFTAVEDWLYPVSVPDGKPAGPFFCTRMSSTNKYVAEVSYCRTAFALGTAARTTVVREISIGPVYNVLEASGDVPSSV